MEEYFEETYKYFAIKANEIKKDEPNVSIIVPRDLLDDSVQVKYLKATSEILKTFTNIKNLHFEIEGFSKQEDINYEGLDFILAALEQHLPKLETLNLNIKSFKLRNEGTKRVMKSLKLASQVSILNLALGDNYIEAEGIYAITETLKEFKSLKELHLNLSYNVPQKEGRESINQMLTSFSKVQCLNLNLGVSDYDEDSIVSFAHGLKSYHNLTKLHLNFDYSFIKKDGVGILVDALEGLTFLNQLTEFTLLVGYPSQFPLEVTYRIAKLITNMSNLEYLNLGANEQNFGDEGGSAVLNALTSLKKLKILQFCVHINYIGTQAFKNFGVKLRSLESLSTINFEMVHNNIGDEGLISILEGLSSLKKLESIKMMVQNNQLTTAVIPSFTLLVKELPLLRDLNIHYGSEDDSKEHFQEFIDALQSASNLKTLKLEFNEDQNSRVDYGFVSLLRDVSNEITQKGKQNQ